MKNTHLENVVKLPVRRWVWTKKKWRCLHLDLRGVQKQMIAHEIGVHKNTITNWTQRSEYVREFAGRLKEHHVSGTFGRRYRTDRIERMLAELCMKSIEAFRIAPEEHKTRLLRQMCTIFRQYRSISDLQREIYGDIASMLAGQ